MSINFSETVHEGSHDAGCVNNCGTVAGRMRRGLSYIRSANHLREAVRQIVSTGGHDLTCQRSEGIYSTSCVNQTARHVASDGTAFLVEKEK